MATERDFDDIAQGSLKLLLRLPERGMSVALQAKPDPPIEPALAPVGKVYRPFVPAGAVARPLASDPSIRRNRDRMYRSPLRSGSDRTEDRVRIIVPRWKRVSWPLALLYWFCVGLASVLAMVLL